MTKSSLFLATALAAAVGAGPVLAQTSGSQNRAAPQAAGSNPPSPNATSSNATSAAAAASTTGSGPQFWTQDNANQFRTSKLKGLNVYNQNNEKLGDIDDIIVDQSGQLKAVVIAVGGFLGIGERNVAVPFNELKFVYNDGSRNVAGAGQGTGMGNQAVKAAGNPSTTGTTGLGLGSAAVPGGPASVNTAAGTPGGNLAAAATRNDGVPDRAILSATKDQLKSAPEFKYRS